MTRIADASARAADTRTITISTGGITVCIRNLVRTRRKLATSGRTSCTGSGRISRTKSCRTWTRAARTSGRLRIRQRMTCTTTTRKTEDRTASAVSAMARTWSPLKNADRYTPSATMPKPKHSRTCRNRTARKKRSSTTAIVRASTPTD